MTSYNLSMFDTPRQPKAPEAKYDLSMLDQGQPKTIWQPLQPEQVQAATTIASFGDATKSASMDKLRSELRQYLGDDAPMVGSLNFEDAQRQLQRAQMDHILRDSPHTARWFTEQVQQGKTPYDVGTLANIERVTRVAPLLPYAAARGAYNTLGGLTAAPGGFADVVGQALEPVFGKLPKSELTSIGNFITEYGRKATGSVPDNLTIGEKGLVAGVESLGANLTTFGMAPFGLQATLATMATSVGGSTYLENLKATGNSAAALLHGILDAGYEYIFEKMGGTGVLFDKAAWAKTFLGGVAKFAAREIPTELATTVAQKADQYILQNPERTFEQFMAEMPEDLVLTAIATLVGGGGQVAIFKGVEALASMGNTTAKAQAAHDNMIALLDNVAKSELYLNDPDTFAQFFQGVAGDATVTVDPVKLVEAMTAANVSEEALPSLKDQLNAPGEIELTVQELATAFAGTGAETTLLQHVRPEPDLPTLAESKEQTKAAFEAFQEAGEKALARFQADEVFNENLKAVKEEVVADILHTGRAGKHYAEGYGTLMAHFYATMAKAHGVTPLQIRDGWTDANGVEHRGYNPRVVGPTGQVRGRTPATTVDFKRGRVANLMNRDNWAVLEAGNPNGTEATPEENAASMAKLKAYLDKEGIEYHDAKGSYFGTKADSLMLLGVTAERASEIGNMFGQESVVTRHGLVFGDGTVAQATGIKEVKDTEAEDHTFLPAFGSAFRLEIPESAFENRVKLNEVLNQSVSTRTPTQKAGRPDPHLTTGLDVDYSVVEQDADLVGRLAAVVKTYPGIKKGLRNPNKIVEAFIKHVEGNLSWLYDNVPPEIRERSKLWYDGGRRIIERWVDKYGFTDAQIAGVIAVLSPQTEWDMNVTRAERILDIWTQRQDFAWSDEMNAEADAIDSIKPVLREAIRGKKLSELDSDLLRGVWIRVYDQAHNPRVVRGITPEGGFTEFKKTKGGKEKMSSWGSFADIGKAVRILRDGSIPNISRSLGSEHKVRNFYNNLFDPSDSRSVTIDTHAVAAGLLRPLAGGSIEVLDNLGAKPRHDPTGTNGTYVLYAEAYRRVAMAKGVLPRELQSITWEAVRRLFPDNYKSDATRAQIDALWKPNETGKESADEIRNKILEDRGGTIPNPAWERSGTGLDVGQPSSTYQSGVLERSWADGTPGTRAGGYFAQTVPATGKPAGLTITGVHFSPGELTNLLPSKYGKGLEGAERARVMASKDARITRRTHFYVNTGQGVFPEAGTGGKAHVSELANLYDADVDALGLFRGKTDEQLNAAESAVLDAGYSGYVMRGFGNQGAAVVFGARVGDTIPTKFVGGKEEASVPVAPAAQYSETQRLRQALTTSKDLPHGAMTASRWREHIGKVLPDLLPKIEASGAFERVQGMVYRDELARAIEPPEGQFYQTADQTNTPEFKKWFGASKVVDKQGKPLVVYHSGDFVAEEHGAFITEGGAHFGTRAAADARSTGRYQDIAVKNEPVYEDDGRFYLDEDSWPGAPSSGFSTEEDARTWLSGEVADWEPDEPAGVTAVYLSIKNPMWVQDQGDDWSNVIAQAKKRGHDGLAYQNQFEDPGSTSYVVFEPTQIKSATGNTGAFDPNDPNILRQSGWYSPLTRAFQNAKQATMPGSQWASWLAGNKAKLGLKDDEIVFSGLDNYLELRGKDKVTREEIVDYLNGNGVRVEDTVKGRRTSTFKNMPTDDKNTVRGILQKYDYLGFDTATEALRAYGENPNAWDMEDEDKAVVNSILGADAGLSPAKFAGYWEDSYKGGIPGTYREILVTLPEREAAKLDDDGQISFTPEKNNAANFRSGHWPDTPNVLVHLRLDEVTGADGNRYVRVGEIQSDWGQEGKKVGFGKEENKYATMNFTVEPQNLRETEWKVSWADGTFLGGYGSMRAAQQAAVDAQSRGGRDRIPSAPFVTDTKAWVALGIKRAIMHAIDVGADGVVFGTGEQNANLYDLSKQVDRLDIEPYGIESGVQQYRVTAMKDGAKAVDRTVAEPELSNVVGKDIAKEAIAGKTRFEGEGLRVGGEGMRAFYDQIVPQVANDVLKKIGGGKVSSIRLGIYGDLYVKRDGETYSVANDDTGEVVSRRYGFRTQANSALEQLLEERTEQPGFPITSEMREKVQAGMPLFQKVWHGTPNIWAPEPGFPHGRPRLDFMGTGEGAQAYGWGWYSAEVKDVASGYSGPGKHKGGQAAETRLAKRMERATDAGRYGEALAIEELLINRSPARARARFKEEPGSEQYREALRVVEELAPNYEEAGLYQLDIPDATLPYLLDWNRPLSEQTKEVQALISDLADDAGLPIQYRKKMYWKDRTGQDFYNAVVSAFPSSAKDSGWTSVAQTQNDVFGSPRRASEFLASWGIVGNRYLDGQSRNRPLKDIKREFLAELPEDADASEVAELIGTGKFSPKNDALLRALRDDDWLGFDYPAQAVSTALSNDLSGYDASPELVRAVSEVKEGGTYNFVIWDQPTLDKIALLERNGEKLDAMREAQLRQTQTSQQGPLGGFNPTTMEIALLAQSNLSTFLHETGHFFLTVYADMAAQEGAPKQIVDDMNAILKWFGIGANPGGMPGEGAVEGSFAQAVDQTSMPEFKRWFGDSKVVDAEGKPLVVYHGTSADFDTFRLRVGDIGMHFGTLGQAEDRVAYIREWKLEQEGNPSVVPVYLHIRNPLRLTDAGSWKADNLDYQLRELFPGDVARIRKLKSTKDIREFLQGKGYDGVVYKNTGEVAGSEPYRIKVNEARAAMDKVFPKGKSSFSLEDQKVPEYQAWSQAQKEYSEYREAAAEDSYIAFSPAQIKSAIGNQGTFDPTNPNILRQGGAPGTRGPLPYGRTPLEVWNAMSVDQQRPYHEQFAESFEQYLFSGKAPTRELQSLFQRFAKWLTRVYGSIKEFVAGHPGAKIDPEMAAVMDRMLATEAEIAAAEDNRNYEALFRTAAEAGMTPAQFAAYLDLPEEARARAEENLRARSMRDMKWLQNRRNRTIAALQKEAAAARAEVRKEVAETVAQEPIFRALRWLKRGELTNPDTGEEVKAIAGNKLSIPALEGMYPEGALGDKPDWRSLGYGQYGMLANEGQHPDIVADMFGFDSGAALVDALVNAPKFKDEVEGRTDQIMLERHGDLSSPDKIAQAADEAIHNEVRTKLVATELSFLDKLTGSPSFLIKAAKEYARQLVANRTSKTLKAWVFAADEVRASKAAAAALKKGDTKAAANHKRVELLNHAAVREAHAAEKELKKIVDRLRKIASYKDDDSSAKVRDMDMVNAVRVVLYRFGLGTERKGKAATEYLSLVETNDPAMGAALRDLVDSTTDNAKDWRDLKLSELRDLHDAVEAVWTLAKRSRQMEVDGKLVPRRQIEQELYDRLDEIGIPDTMPGETSAVTESERNWMKFSTFVAALRRVESWVEAKDGKAMGPFRKYIWSQIKDAAGTYRVKKAEYLKAYRELLDTIAPTLKRELIDAREIGYTFGKGEGGMGMVELLHAILHTGNASNKRKLLLGRGWATDNGDGTLDTSKWDAFVARMIQEGKLTKAHYDFAQGVWDLLDSTKIDAQKAHRSVFGRYFAEVTADAFTTPFGDYRGGYVPAQADPEIVQDAQLKELANQENENMVYAFPSTPKGFTKSRVEYNRPLRLDLRSLAGHIDKVLLFSYLTEPVSDVRRVIMSKTVSQALGRVDPKAIGVMLTPWLNRVAKQVVEDRVPGREPLARFWSIARARAGMSAMFANLANSVQQITGISLAAVKVRPKHLLEAMAHGTMSPRKLAAHVAAMSPYMRDRMHNDVVLMGEAIDEILLNPGVYESAKAWSAKHAYFMQRAVDNYLSPMIWMGAFNQAKENGSDDLEARRLADSAVRETQGSQAPEDIAAFEQGTAFYRMFVQFAGYFNMNANLLGTEFVKISRDMGLKKGAGRGLYVLALGFYVPAVLGELIIQAFRGGPDDDDKDGEYLDDWLAAVFGYGPARYLTAMAPVVGQAANALFNTLNNKPYDDRISTAPAISMIESAVKAPISVYKAIADEGKSTKAVNDAATLISMTVGVPARAVAKPISYLTGVANEEIAPEDTYDAIRGTITGTASPGSKQ